VASAGGHGRAKSVKRPHEILRDISGLAPFDLVPFQHERQLSIPQ
jgi:hypothetical protein